jgi:hypothetical protein
MVLIVIIGFLVAGLAFMIYMYFSRWRHRGLNEITLTHETQIDNPTVDVVNIYTLETVPYIPKGSSDVMKP